VQTAELLRLQHHQRLQVAQGMREVLGLWLLLLLVCCLLPLLLQPLHGSSSLSTQSWQQGTALQQHLVAAHLLVSLWLVLAQQRQETRMAVVVLLLLLLSPRRSGPTRVCAGVGAT
jgi:hypothetical protein